MRAGERLFASEGIDRVQLRDINGLAGQRNESALHYHFGSRQGLLEEILARHGHHVQERTRQLLDRQDGRSRRDLRFLIGALVVPLSEKLGSEDGRDYLRILAQALGRGELPHGGTLAAPWVAPPVRRCLDEIERRLGRLPDELRRERTARLSELVLVSMAGRARQIEEGRPPIVNEPTFVANLIEMSVAALSAPLPHG